MKNLKVNPTRINLLRLKKELKTAEKGYKLLKDKRDGLMKKFMELIGDTKRLRQKVEEELRQSFLSYAKASTSLSPKVLETIFLVPNTKLSMTVKTQSVMSVPIPRFSLEKSGNIFCYGYLETNGDLDLSLAKLDSVFPDLVKLAELEQAIENLSLEIEKTRRRTNALEHNIIPTLKDSIRSIAMRLEEQARDAIVSTMRIKARLVEQV